MGLLNVLVNGRTAQFTLLVFFWALTALGVMLSRKSYGLSMPSMFQIRKLPALDAVEELIARATEMGRPIGYVTAGSPTTTQAPQYIAGLKILTYVAELNAKLGGRMIVSCYAPDALPFNRETVQTAYRKVGVPEKYDEMDVRFTAPDQLAAATTIAATNFRENIAVQFFVGHLTGNTTMILGGKPLDAINFAATANTSNMAFMVSASQYFLIAAELFAASAYLSEDDAQVGSLFGEEMMKWFLVAVTIIGVVALALGNPFMVDLLKR